MTVDPDAIARQNQKVIAEYARRAEKDRRSLARAYAAADRAVREAARARS